LKVGPDEELEQKWPAEKQPAMLKGVARVFSQRAIVG
jgi:hypothetical protein